MTIILAILNCGYETCLCLCLYIIKSHKKKPSLLRLYKWSKDRIEFFKKIVFLQNE